MSLLDVSIFCTVRFKIAFAVKGQSFRSLWNHKGDFDLLGLRRPWGQATAIGDVGPSGTRGHTEKAPAGTISVRRVQLHTNPH